MWAAMESNGDIVHTKTNDEGVSRVKKENGNYAFMMESVPMEYQTNKECTIQHVGELLDSKGYGIALPINSPYRKAFSEQILKLSESGVLNELKNKWWKSNISKKFIAKLFINSTNVSQHVTMTSLTTIWVLATLAVFFLFFLVAA